MKAKLNTLIAILVVAAMVTSGCIPAPAPALRPTQAEAPAASLTTPSVCAPIRPAWNPTTAETGRKSITIAFEQEPDLAVGMFSAMNFAIWIWQMIGIGPGRWDDQNSLVPYMATEIPSAENGGISPDGLTVTWRLKSCLFWSDGQPLTSRDFAFTWKAMMDPGNTPFSRSGWDQIAGIDTPDDQTVIIHFKELYAAWPTLFNLGPNNTAGGLLPEHIFASKTGLEKDPQVHTPTWAAGPFAIKEWMAGDHMTLVRNPNYFGMPAKLDSINVKFVPNPETGLAALRTGEADLMVNLAESDIEAVKALAPQGIQLRVDPAPEFEHMFFNLGTKAGQTVNGKVVGQSDVNGFCPFQDVSVRRAIMLATDRLSFIKNYLKEDEKAYIATLWPNSYWTKTSLTPYPFDPTQAAQLLDTAGYKVGADGVRAGPCTYPGGTKVNAKFSLGIETTTAQRRVDDVLAIQADLKKIGIDIKPNHIPAGTFFGSYEQGADMATGNFDMAIYTAGYYPDPHPTGLMDCANIPSKANPLGANYYHLCDPKLDEMLAQGLASADAAARKKVYDQIQQYMYDNVLVVPLYARASVYAHNDRFVFPPSSGYAHAFWDSENFDVKN